MESSENLLIEYMLEESVRKAVKYYGIEGCEDAIKRVYTENPIIKQRMLATFKRIYLNNTNK